MQQHGSHPDDGASNHPDLIVSEVNHASATHASNSSNPLANSNVAKKGTNSMKFIGFENTQGNLMNIESTVQKNVPASDFSKPNSLADSHNIDKKPPAPIQTSGHEAVAQHAHTAFTLNVGQHHAESANINTPIAPSSNKNVQPNVQSNPDLLLLSKHSVKEPVQVVSYNEVPTPVLAQAHEEHHAEGDWKNVESGVHHVHPLADSSKPNSLFDQSKVITEFV